ncbi:HRDC domain-containing protein [Ornithinimicrobium pekingense]|uniref:3'-5' exonuclease n=1 Tax=Ornithinimicrobium pekingense TaxID=384677 RepID=A0ABQ2F932_9MICO|nr:ribonuclease D [Ornithinimicrobium pekingense]GGK70661.1 3'-5' exonuclease [Ornithinimicrobium pekingense]
MPVPGDPDLDPDPTSDYERVDVPAEGVPHVVDTEQGLAEVVDALSRGTGPIAVDAERASGFRYGQKAYLVQLRRRGSGTWLIDPVPFEDLSALDEVLAQDEWVLHAATQDIPCLDEAGLRPRALFDTELGARLAGLPRVGLSASLEYYLGVTLAKEHSAVDWSTRPLPEPWLRYAALDVELLVELRDRMERDLAEQGKLEWARQEFAALVDFTPRDHNANGDAWRRTSGIHRLRKPRNNAALRELWLARDEIARERDVSPGRVVPDSTLVDLATRMPRQAAALAPAKPDRSRSRQRRAEQGLLRYQRTWLAALRRAAELPDDELPEPTPRGDGPPPARAWPERDPAAADRLALARTEIAALSERLDIPAENLMTPESVRRVLWRPPRPATEEAVDQAFADLGARPWQRELITPVVVAAVDAHP